MKLAVVLAMTFISSVIWQKTNAQCSYLTVSPEKVSSLVQIPSDFPVIDYSNASAEEQNNFNNELKSWKLKNPGFDALTFVPANDGSVGFINIPKSEFEAFSNERKQIILNSAFYHLIN